jgi:hypothetical protein
MGDISAKGEGILGGYVENQVVLHANTCLSIKDYFKILSSFNSDKLKYFQGKAVGYDKCKFSTAQGAALMFESKGARKNEF